MSPPPQQHRSSPKAKKALPPHARPSKTLPPLARGRSTHSIPKAGPGWRKGVGRKEEDDQVMAATFLQFCATCEKQIVFPNNSVLYCSESCRRKDSGKTMSYTPTSDHAPPLTPFGNLPFEDLPNRDIVPQSCPTILRPQAISYSETSEEDAECSCDEGRYETEAARYLREFRSPSAAPWPASRPMRPRYSRGYTPSAVSTAPSLSHTPMSSVGTSYTPFSRPLPPRTNPHCTSFGSRSIELVTPFFSMPTSAPPSSSRPSSFKSEVSSKTTTRAAEGELLFQKGMTPSGASPSQGSLKQLFRFGEMQALPKETEEVDWTT
ncbi:hypothetical protein BJ546DRAFT_834493 [Cryomyces antarcticus]